MVCQEIGLTAYGSPRRVKRWLDGDSDPDYQGTMAILLRLGMLRDVPETAEPAHRQEEHDPLLLLRELLVAVAATQATSGLVVDRLEALEHVLEVQEHPAEGQQSADEG